MTSVAQSASKLTGAEIRLLLEDRWPGITEGVADTTIETKINLIGLRAVDLLHDDSFGQQEFVDIMSPVVPSSLSHRRWVIHLDNPLDRLNAFRRTYVRG